MSCVVKGNVEYRRREKSSNVLKCIQSVKDTVITHPFIEKCNFQFLLKDMLL